MIKNSATPRVQREVVEVVRFSIKGTFLIKSEAGYGKIAAAAKVEILMRVNQYGMKKSRI